MGNCAAVLVPAEGHINPAAPILAELAGRGERVVTWATEPFRQQIERTGAEFRAYPSAFNSWPWPHEGGLLAGLAARLECAEQILPELVDSIAREAPDYLLLDAGATWGLLAAQILERPAASITLAFVVDQQLISEAALLRLLYGDTPAPALLQALVNLARLSETARRLDRRFGTRTPGVLGALACRQQVNLVLTSRSFQPCGESLDQSYVFVGRDAGPRPPAPAFPWEWLGAAPLILISMGTIHNGQVRFYQACFEAFADLPCRCVLATGRGLDPGPVPANFRVSEYVPQLELLERARLFVTHCGSNSVHEALRAGVPMLAYPQGSDHFAYAARLVELGAGLRVQPAADPATLRSLALEILGDPAFARQARVLGDSLRAAGGAALAAESLLWLTTLGRTRSDRPGTAGAAS
jgi:MGT family glycosyltransferase